jgi:hypothetical protein
MPWSDHHFEREQIAAVFKVREPQVGKGRALTDSRRPSEQTSASSLTSCPEILTLGTPCPENRDLY